MTLKKNSVFYDLSHPIKSIDIKFVKKVSRNKAKVLGTLIELSFEKGASYGSFFFSSQDKVRMFGVLRLIENQICYRWKEDPETGRLRLLKMAGTEPRTDILIGPGADLYSKDMLERCRETPGRMPKCFPYGVVTDGEDSHIAIVEAINHLKLTYKNETRDLMTRLEERNII